MEVSEACQARAIATIEARTPLLVPSFSSRGFENVADIHLLFREYLFEASLVSAYDLHHELLRQEEIYATEVLILDSGGYEARPTVDPAEPYLDERPGANWTLGDYERVLGCLQPLSRLVVVSFDVAAPLVDQVRLARSLFDQHPLLASDFLCKPTSADAPFVDVDSLIAGVDEVASFDILGIAEKELGESVLDRCQNVLRVREALHRRGHETPIHIFGCLDPLTVLAYFLCGADIFDGLSWLRFTLVEGLPIYHASSIILNRQWVAPDWEVVAAHRVQNLRELRDQTRVMRLFTEKHDLDELPRLPNGAPHLIDLVRAAGLEI